MCEMRYKTHRMTEVYLCTEGQDYVGPEVKVTPTSLTFYLYFWK